MNIQMNEPTANKYGMAAGVLLLYIYNWVKHNTANRMHFNNGYYWTYNSYKGFKEEFGFLTDYQIRTTLETLRKERLILCDDLSGTANRSLYYTITPKGVNLLNGIDADASAELFPDKLEPPKDEQQPIKELDELENQTHIEDIVAPTVGVGTSCEETPPKPFVENDKCIMRNQQMHLSNSTNAYTNNIPTNIETTNIKEKTHKKESEPDNVCVIFNAWNSSNLLICETLDNKTKLAIETALKRYSVEQILLHISRYSEMLNNADYFMECRWSLKAFMYKGNALPHFADNGEKWLAYCDWKKNQSKIKHSTPTKQDFIHNNYDEEQIRGCFADLDNTEV